MKALIIRTSDDKAKKYTREDIVRIITLKDLLTLMQKEQHSVIIYDKHYIHDYDGITAKDYDYTIEIYDSWRD